MDAGMRCMMDGWMDEWQIDCNQQSFTYIILNTCTYLKFSHIIDSIARAIRRTNVSHCVIELWDIYNYTCTSLYS